MNLLQMSLSGAVMILVIVVIRALAINKLPKKAFLVLWGVVVVRLLVPYSFSSTFSVYSLLGRLATTAETANGNPAVPFTPMAPTYNVIPGTTATNTTAPATVCHLWVVGVLACAVFFAVAYWRCRKEFKASLPVDTEYVKLWLSEHHIFRNIEIRQSDRISAPLTYGVFRPIILMPKTVDWDDLDTLKYVLTHEYVHIRRFDAVTKLVLTVALCVHWFNPAVWIMYVLVNRDIEISCDEAVIRAFGERTKSAYAMALIRMEETQSSLSPLCNNFSKNAIEERIVAIMKYKKTTIIGVALTLALVLAVTVAFASNPVPDKESTTSARGSIVGSEDELLKFNIDLDLLEESLAEHVANGSMTEEDAAYYLTRAKAASRDGMMMKWIFAEDNRLFLDTDSYGTSSIYYMDENGNKVYVDPAMVLSEFIFAANDTND